MQEESNSSWTVSPLLSLLILLMLNSHVVPQFPRSSVLAGEKGRMWAIWRRQRPGD